MLSGVGDRKDTCVEAMEMKLIIPVNIVKRMYSIVYETEYKTSVTLFGEKEGEDFTVAAIAGPGPQGAHDDLPYSVNEDYATMILHDLQKDRPDLIRIGTLYVHPFKTTRPSVRELMAVHEMLIEHEEFISGVILRNHHWDFKVFPLYFSRGRPEGIEMKVRFEGQPCRRYRPWFRRRSRR
jgi:hypothetical protein